jgi:hypothetical protein
MAPFDSTHTKALLFITPPQNPLSQGSPGLRHTLSHHTFKPLFESISYSFGRSEKNLLAANTLEESEDRDVGSCG